MKRTRACLSFLTIVILFVASSCNEKMTCDNIEGIQILKSAIKNDLIEARALKLAAEDWEYEKYNFWADMHNGYKTYLLQQLAEIKNQEGDYYEAAAQDTDDDNIEVRNIIADHYDETVNRCECSAEVSLTNLLTNSDSRNKITYSLVNNSEGRVTGTYRYRTKIMLDHETNASDFIKGNKDQF